MADLESRINRIASRVAKLYRDPHPRDELEFKRRRPSNYELNDLDDEENIDFVNNDSFENVSDYFDTEGELNSENFCSRCENENAKDVRTEREWVDLYLKEGLLKDGVDPREFDDEDPICSDCAEELLEPYFADTADRRIASVMNSIRLARELRRIARQVATSKIPPFPGDKSKSIEADNDEKRELENILGPEELYGGGIVEAWFEPSAKIIKGKKALVGGTLYVYSDGDFGEDEDGNFVNGGWLKFNASKVVDYYCYNDDDGEDFIGWFRSDVITTNTIDAEIVNVFDYDITQWLEYEYGV